MTDLYLQRPSGTAPSLQDLVLVYPVAGNTPGGVDSEAAQLKASNNPEQLYTLEALRDALTPPASTTVSPGLVELATVEQARAGVDSVRAVTPEGLAAAIAQGVTGGLSLSLTSLNDTPSALGSAGQFLRVNTARSSLEWTDAILPTGAQIVSALRVLTGNARLPATAVRDLPAGTLAGLTDVPAIGTTGQVLAVNSDRTGVEWVDTASGGGGLASIVSDASLSGAGTTASPLSVVNPITAAQLNKLDGIAAGAEVNVNADWNATSGDARILNKPDVPSAPTAVGVRNLLETLGENDRLPATAIRGLTTGATAFTGLTDTPAALGSARQILRMNAAATAIEFADAPLSITQSERNKLALVEPSATADQTGAEIATALSALTGNARLSYNSLRDLPADLASVSSDASLTGTGTTASPLSVANPFTTADEAKLDGIEPNATADQTATELVTALAALTGSARLPASAISGLDTQGQIISTGIGLNLLTTPINVSRGVGDAGHQIIPLTDGKFYTIVFQQPAASIGISAATKTFLFSDSKAEVILTRDELTQLNTGSDTSTITSGAIAQIRNNSQNQLFINLSGFNGTNQGLHISGIYEFGVDDVAYFTGLTDTPNSLTGQGGKYLRVNTGGTALEFVDAPSGGDDNGGESVTTFAGLTDTPASLSGQGGKYLAVNTGGTALEFVDAPSGGDDNGGESVTTFAGLTDTPSTLLNQGGKRVAVNADGTALEFVTSTFDSVELLTQGYTTNSSSDAVDIGVSVSGLISGDVFMAIVSSANSTVIETAPRSGQSTVIFRITRNSSTFVPFKDGEIVFNFRIGAGNATIRSIANSQRVTLHSLRKIV